nr:CD81 antigen isoform X3 [Loxodonta africana]
MPGGPGLGTPARPVRPRISAFCPSSCGRLHSGPSGCCPAWSSRSALATRVGLCQLAERSVPSLHAASPHEGWRADGLRQLHSPGCPLGWQGDGRPGTPQYGHLQPPLSIRPEPPPVTHSVSAGGSLLHCLTLAFLWRVSQAPGPSQCHSQQVPPPSMRGHHPLWGQMRVQSQWPQQALDGPSGYLGEVDIESLLPIGT